MRSHRYSTTRHVRVVLILAVALTLTAAPSHADSSGSVSARVRAVGPCIEISPANVDFGDQALSTADWTATPAALPVSVLNCARQAEQLFGMATDATSATSGAVWTLGYLDSDVSICALGPDIYGLGLWDQTVKGAGPSWLTSDTQTLITEIPDPRTSLALRPLIAMPCLGSGGVDEYMEFSFHVTAVLP